MHYIINEGYDDRTQKEMMFTINPLRKMVNIDGLGTRLANLQIRDFFDHVSEQLPESEKAKNYNIILAIDATENRQQTWDLAMSAQQQIFQSLEEDMQVRIQLVYFSGIDGFKTTNWIKDPNDLNEMMSQINCQGGSSQIIRVLKHVQNAASEKKIHAVILLGQVVEDSFADISRVAGELAQSHIPIYTLYESADNASKQALIEIARLTKGASIPFDHTTPRLLSKIFLTLSTFLLKGKEATLELVSKDPVIDKIYRYLP